jgi:peptide/nickel transport system permease protein
LTVALITASFGVVIGAASAYLGGMANNIIMRVTDAFLAFPIIVGVVFFQQFILLLIDATGNVFYSQGYAIALEGTVPALIQFLLKIDPVMLALIVFSWMIYARITNTIVMTVKQSEYVVAAQALGAGHGRIIFRHLVPNTISPSIVLMAKDIGGLVLLQAAFTFIGIGGNSEWGQLLAFGRRYVIGPGGNIFTYWWTFMPATIVIILFGVGWNLLGDGLSDWLNPRSGQHFDM